MPLTSWASPKDPAHHPPTRLDPCYQILMDTHFEQQACNFETRLDKRLAEHSASFANEVCLAIRSITDSMASRSISQPPDQGTSNTCSEIPPSLPNDQQAPPGLSQTMQQHQAAPALSFPLAPPLLGVFAQAYIQQGITFSPSPPGHSSYSSPRALGRGFVQVGFLILCGTAGRLAPPHSAQWPALLRWHRHWISLQDARVLHHSLYQLHHHHCQPHHPHPGTDSL